ncbi:NDR1/HIN1-like protein [Pontibacter cellulosilyticus]|uniref:LEA type 2 family protein n=1 Tax=Pontibacter cellulosilyticus TaxID=1720253 RepID=A0A923SHZ3_9BACT|nr:LEA type 2 family protein [Pontibacter cellulosilyticus]MBC5992062.1 LEA type 2 family protein [Pontibacter cellulosilyticus]
MKKTGWIILVVLLLALIGGIVYFVVKKKYYPKVKGVEYINLEMAKDTAFIKTGINVQNRIPLPIAIDSIRYVFKDQNDTIGRGRMTTDHTLPALGDKVVDFKMQLDFEKYREHIKEQQGKDSIKIDVAMEAYFDLPFISPQSIAMDRQITVPVAKSPEMQVSELKVRSFSVEEGYSLLLRINATNKNLPGLKIDNFQYNIRLGDTLRIEGQIDSTFAVDKGSRLLEIPLELSTADAIALLKKKLSGGKSWEYDAVVEAQIQSQHPLFDSFNLTVEKSGVLDAGGMGAGSKFLPSISKIKRLEVDSDEETTRIQADIIVHNPSPFPFYIDSAAYYIRHKGTVIARGKRNYEKILPKSGDQSFRLDLLVDESAYQNFMKQVQGQEKVSLEVELNLIYNLPDTKQTQKLSLKRQVQVPVPGQAGIQVAGLEVRELDPQKGAYLGLQLKIQSSNLPDLQIKNLDYRLQLSDDILLQGQTKEPIKVNGKAAEVEIPIRLSAEDVNQLVKKAISGSSDWKYDLQATATLSSSNKMLGSTKVDLDFNGTLELTKGSGGQLMPQITKIDTLDITIAFDTAWVKLNVHVKNPLPVPIQLNNIALQITHESDTFAMSQEKVSTTLPPEGSQTGWITLGVNYKTWRDHLQHHQQQDSMLLEELITLGYQIDDLAPQQVSFTNKFMIPMPKVPVTELQKVKPKGISLKSGIVLNALVQVQNANTESLDISDITYNICAENLLDACGSINRTYHIPLGQSIVEVPMSLTVGEVFRALFAQLTGKKKQRTIYINTSAMIDTANPKIKNTFVRFEKWERTVLFQKKKKIKSKKEVDQVAQ